MPMKGDKVVGPGMPYRLLGKEEALEQARRVPLWTLGDTDIRREFRFKDFREAMAFVNRVADLSEGENHHPDIFISYNRVVLTLSTHKVGGLSPRDFLLAVKVDEVLQGPRIGDGGGAS